MTIFGVQIFAVAVLFAFATAGTAFADNSITKTFEFGIGQAYTHSNVRTFPIPCGILEIEDFTVRLICKCADGTTVIVCTSSNNGCNGRSFVSLV